MIETNDPTVKLTTPSDREVAVTREFDAPRELVWEAWTSPKHLPHWLLGPEGWTMPVCEVDLRPGGAYRYVWHRPGRPEMEIRGVNREVVAPERLICTEWWGDNWPESINTMLLTEENGRTTVTLTMLYPSKEARDKALGTGMMDGTSRSYARLDAYLSTMQ